MRLIQNFFFIILTCLFGLALLGQAQEPLADDVVLVRIQNRIDIQKRIDEEFNSILEYKSKNNPSSSEAKTPRPVYELKHSLAYRQSAETISHLVNKAFDTLAE